MTQRRSSTPGGATAIGAFTMPIFNDVGGTSKQRIHGTSPRSGQPVWRNSYYVGTKEDQIWKPINGGTKRGGKRWTQALLGAAKRFELKTRAERRETEPGARNGELGEVGLAVLEYLYSRVDYATGRLEPAIRTIANDIGRAYSAVHNALKRLRRHGFLHWMRRSEPIENPEPGGPLVRQVSNAYQLLCPKGMRDWLTRLVGKPPQPECESDRRQREKAEFNAMLDSLTAQERLKATWNGDSLRGHPLWAMARAVDERERRERESSTGDEIGGL